MIYNGKEYEWIAKEDFGVGDLLHITSVSGVACDIHMFITRFDEDGAICVGEKLPDGSYFVNSVDTFKVYEYVKDVEEASPFSVGDTVEVTDVSVTGRDGYIGNTAVITDIFDDGDIEIDEGRGAIYPPSSLELIEKPTQPIAEELSQTVESNATTLAEATRDKLNEVAEGKVSTKKIAVFAVMEYSFSHQGLVNKKEVDRHGTLDRATAVSEGLNNRNRKCFYSVDGILV